MPITQPIVLTPAQARVLGAVLRPLSSEDDLLEEMLEGRV